MVPFSVDYFKECRNSVSLARVQWVLRTVGWSEHASIQLLDIVCLFHWLCEILTGSFTDTESRSNK